jgi:uncharacterized repeat protein (TIGR01451 family)
LKPLGISGALGVLSLAVFGCNQAYALGAPAGTAINNTAEVSYTIGSVSSTTASNQVTVTVAEILDVNVTAQIPSTGFVPVTAGEAQAEVRYLVTNTGNSTETFLLMMDSVIAGDQFDPVPAAPSIYFDTDGSNDLSPGDVAYVPGSNDPVLSADGSVSVLVVNDIPSGLVDGNGGRTRLTASARTGTGAGGTVFAGLGTNLVGATPIDAVVGANGASGQVTAEYRVAGVSLTAQKSQAVVDQFGGSSPVPGATINYSIVINVTGTGAAVGVVFSDPIPANTTYVPGTLRLNTLPLTDTADADAGDYAAAAPARVRVVLGDLTSSSGPQTVTFAVLINAN